MMNLANPGDNNSGPPTILCISPALAVDVTYLVPQLQLGSVHRPHHVLRRVGSKAANVARVLQALGSSVELLGPVGGWMGEWLIESGAEEALPISAVSVPGFVTRTCVSVCTESGQPPTDFYEPSPGLGDHGWRALTEAVEQRPQPDVTVLAGSLPADVTVDRLAALTATSAKLVVDLHGPVATEWLPTIRPALLKVNLKEAQALTQLGADAAPRDVLRKLHTHSGAELTVVTLGADGALAVNGAVEYVVGSGQYGDHPVGSGDAFTAGLVHSLWGAGAGAAGAGDFWAGLAEALAYATAAGGVNAQHLGAGSVTKAEVDAAYAALMGAESQV